MARDIVSEQQNNIDFVRAVQQQPCLYNYDLPSYSRRDVTDKAWEEIGNAMNMTSAACRERWRNLRAVFMRTMKAPKKKPYYLAEVMQFIVPFMRSLVTGDTVKKSRRLTAREVTRNSSDSDPLHVDADAVKNETIDNDDEDIETHEEATVLPQTRKRFIDTDASCHRPKKIPAAHAPSSNVTLENDAVKSFINSLLPELNEMNSAQFKSFKRKVLLLIDDITAEIPSGSKHREDGRYIM